MTLLAAGLAFDLLLAWLICRVVAQARAYKSLPGNLVAPAGGWPKVCVVVPARNEAANIARCLSALLAQDYPAAQLSIRLIDDGSTDGTPELAREVAGSDGRFELAAGAPLPTGWTGKSFACNQGARLAGEVAYLCFMDADTAAAPGLIRTAVAYAEATGTDMLSLEPFQELGSAFERLIIPCGLYLVAASQDLSRINAAGSASAAANGQFLLFRRDAYERLGGHAAVRAKICEDTALARAAKGAGMRFALLGAERLIRTRMYRDRHSLWEGLAKNATELAGGPLRTVLIATCGAATIWTGIALAILALVGLAEGVSLMRIAAACVIFAGAAALLGLHLAGARHFRIPLAYGLAFPLGYLLAFALALDAARLKRTGRVRWKDRVYAEPSPRELRALRTAPEAGRPHRAAG